MTNNNKESLSLDVLGKIIAGILCDKYYHLNNVLVVQDAEGNSKVIEVSSLEHDAQLYQIDNEEIVQVKIAGEGTMFLFYTHSKQFLVNEKNEIVEDSSNWSDFFFDDLSHSFYRKDKQGFWYDIEGFKVQEKVFIKGDVLVSLDTKLSKQSLSFQDQEIFISKNKQIIQVGKLVFNLKLDVLRYFGEKITGLGKTNISFEENDVVQEVKLGLIETAFIHEFTHEPYVFGERKIVKHAGSFQYGKKRVEIFETDKNTYGVEGSSNHFLMLNGKPLEIETKQHVSIKDAELIRVSDGHKSFYFDLNKYEKFDLPSLVDKNISDIDTQFTRIGKEKIFNVSTPSEKFAIQEEDGSLFKLDDGKIKPEKIEDAEALSQYYGFAWIDGERKLFSKKNRNILRFGKDALEVSEIIFNSSDKLINAIDTNGNKLVLDLRLGFEEVHLAESKDGTKITEVYGNPMPFGNKTLMNVFIETLGGSSRRVIDLNVKDYTFFTLPDDLKEIDDRAVPSVFAGNYITEIKYFEERLIDGLTFISAEFMAFTGKEYPVILEKSSGRPLHLHGIGHRNELASTWEDYTLQKSFFLGNNRMIGVRTIGEDQKENRLLFSINKLTSWLPFYENYLPLFKHIIDIEDRQQDEYMDYHLFELREISKEKEYLAVEKIPPYRILVDEKSGEYRPRIVKTKKKGIKIPDEITSLLRFFYDDKAILADVE